MQRGMQILPRVLPEFMSRYPHVRVELEEFGSNTLEKMVLDGTCDLALITTTPSNSRLRYQLIENEEILLIAARSTQLARSHSKWNAPPHRSGEGGAFHQSGRGPQHPHGAGSFVSVKRHPAGNSAGIPQFRGLPPV